MTERFDTVIVCFGICRKWKSPHLRSSSNMLSENICQIWVINGHYSCSNICFDVCTYAPAPELCELNWLRRAFVNIRKTYLPNYQQRSGWIDALVLNMVGVSCSCMFVYISEIFVYIFRERRHQVIYASESTVLKNPQDTQMHFSMFVHTVPRYMFDNVCVLVRYLYWREKATDRKHPFRKTRFGQI